ncbi:MAG: precorrin-6y C5,15-methyltransferase (decarboxylating) subunit CbiE [Syntrophobacteraceae bacterium]
MNTIKSCPEPDKWTPPLIAVVGLGAGPRSIGAEALEWITAAEVLVGGKRHLELFPEYRGRKVALKSPLSEGLEEIGRISQHHRTAVLASGDPLFFGIGKALAKAFGLEGLFIVPGVTSIQVLCARICEPWGRVECVSFHGREEPNQLDRLLHLLGEGRKVAVLTDPVHTPGWIARELIECGHGSCSLVVGEGLGSGSERIRSLSPSETVDEAFSPLNVVLIRPGERDEIQADVPGQVFGFYEEAFDRDAGMITKMEVRAVTLALLGLGPGQIMWDLGAATGSVSIEAVRAARLKRVFAVEKNKSRYSKLCRNIEKFGVTSIEPVCSEASIAVPGLPDPDRVFIGGSGDDIGEILKVVERKLLPGGRVVQTIVLLETLEKVKSFWKDRGFEISVTHLQVSRSRPTGKDVRLEALNPVFIVSAWRS